MDNFRRGNDRLRRKIRLVHVLHDALSDTRGRAVFGRDGGKRSIFVIGVLIERRHIHAVDFAHTQEKFLLRAAVLFRLPVAVDDLLRDLLALAERKKVDEVCQRLGIHRAHAPGKDDILKAFPLARQKRHTGKLQHIQNVRVAHLVADRERDQIERLHRVMALEGVKGNGVLSHLCFHVAPRREHPLAPHARHLIHEPI